MRSCGSCVGGRGCGGRVGGPKGCCLNRIANGGRVCRNQDDTGCMVEYKKKKPKEERDGSTAISRLSPAPTARASPIVTLWEKPLGHRDQFTLIVSYFVSDHPHTAEITAAIRENLRNPLISRVLLLLENMTCFEARTRLSANAAGAQNIEKIACAEYEHQPTYANFFDMAHRLPSVSIRPERQLVMISNADVVFDESLRRVNIDQLRRKKKVAVLAVSANIQSSGRYSRALASPACTNVTERCFVDPLAPHGFGSSWDVYLFGAPLWHLEANAMDISGSRVVASAPIRGGAPVDMDFPMNLRGAEHRCGMALHQAGARFTNICQHVMAEHWHCTRKMRPNRTRVNLKSFRTPPCLEPHRCDGLVLRRDKWR